MVALETLRESSAAIISRTFGPALHRVIVEPSIDSFGDDVVRVTAVLETETGDRMTEGRTLDLLVAIRNEFSALGEERWPLVRYATESDLASAESDDSDEPGPV